MQESAGELFLPIEMPEPPRSSFLKGMSTLFASQKDSFDLDTIRNFFVFLCFLLSFYVLCLYVWKLKKISVVDKNYNSAPGCNMRSVAKTIPGPSNMDQAVARGVSAGQAANMALQVIYDQKAIEIIPVKKSKR